MNKIPQIVPELRFPEFMNDGSWNNLQLGKVADVSKLAGYEFTKHIVYENEGEIIALRGLNIKNNRLDLTDVKYIDNSELSKLGRSKLYIDDLMFTYIGTIGEVALIEENNKYYLAPNVSRIRVNKEKIFPKFILHHFNTTDFKKIEIAKYVSSSSQPALTMGNVRRFLISVPPRIQEQQKIAICLSSLDEVINAETEKLELLQDHKKGLLQQLFPQEGETQPKYRFPEFKNDGDWVTKKLSKLGKIINGLTYRPNDIQVNGLLVLRSSNVQNGQIVLDDCVFVNPDIKGANISRPNDILICVRNGSKQLIGKNAILPEGLPKSTHGAFMTIFRANNPTFTFQLFQTESYRSQVKADLGATINSINTKNFIKYEFVIPKNSKEQEKIASFLSAADDLIEAQSQKIEDLQNHKKGLLQQLFPKINS